MLVGDFAAESGLEESQIHDVLRNDRRRLAIEALQRDGGSVSVRELSETVAAEETGTDPPPRDKRQSVYVSLHQTHLPKLDRLGIVDYDANAKRVELRDRIAEVEVYMEVVPRYALSWGEFYFGLGALGVVTTIAVVIGVPILGSLDIAVVSIAFFSGLMLASAYHVYTQQERIIFQRIRQ